MIELTNEFGGVRLTVDHDGNGPRLRVHSLRTGTVGYLDPLDLESLAVSTADVRAALVNPEHRWV